jgi:hypothetical protein
MRRTFIIDDEMLGMKSSDFIAKTFQADDSNLTHQEHSSSMMKCLE